MTRAKDFFDNDILHFIDGINSPNIKTRAGYISNKQFRFEVMARAEEELKKIDYKISGLGDLCTLISNQVLDLSVSQKGFSLEKTTEGVQSRLNVNDLKKPSDDKVDMEKT